VSTVRFPPVLRAAVGGAREISIPGATVADVLDALYAAHPEVQAQLVAQNGELHRFVNIYVNDEDVRLQGWLATPLAESDTLLILPAMAGGTSSSR
jgi:molybdopterin converting factor small subunit